jgi:hypothetical protein
MSSAVPLTWSGRDDRAHLGVEAGEQSKAVAKAWAIRSRLAARLKIGADGPAATPPG